MWRVDGKASRIGIRDPRGKTAGHSGCNQKAERSRGCPAKPRGTVAVIRRRGEAGDARQNRGAQWL